MDLPSRLLSILLIHLFLITITTSTDISPGQTLYASNPNQTWSSPNSTFSLGFIPITSTSTSSFSAAITYNGIPIWQAGGAVDSGAVLQFLPSGNLRLANGSGATVWLSNTAGLGVSTATLEDSGNLVLKNGTVSVWSTFENPTDTIVPSQNFTVDKVLRNGLYSFSLLQSGNLTLKWNNSIVYWNLGNSAFVGNLTSPSLGIQSIGILTIWDLKLSSPMTMAYSNDYAEGSDILRFLKLDSDGNLRIYSSPLGSGTISTRWAAVTDQCQVFAYCGSMGICSYNGSNPICGCPSSENFDPIDPKDSKKGCKRKVEIEDCPRNTTMLELEHTQFLTYPPETSSQIFFVGITACRLNCLVASSCVGSTSLSDGTGLCYFKTPDFVSGYQSPALPSTSYVKVCRPVYRKPGTS